MKNRYIFLRHGETEKNKNVHAKLWSLSKKGEKQAMNLLNDLESFNINIIYSSEENKAIETVIPISKKISKEINRLNNFNELKRGSKYLNKNEFFDLKKRKLEDLNCSIDLGETGNQAIVRFKKGIQLLDKNYSNKKILISSHGTILSLYFAHIKNDFSDIYLRWKKLKFCAFGIIENNKIIKDIL